MANPSPPPTPNSSPSPLFPASEPTPNPTPADIQRSKKISTLHTKIHLLNAQITSTTAQIATITPQLTCPDSSKTVNRHIRLLHEYNEIRDVGQGLIGLIADDRGVRVRDVYGEFGVGQGD